MSRTHFRRWDVEARAVRLPAAPAQPIVEAEAPSPDVPMEEMELVGSESMESSDQQQAGASGEERAEATLQARIDASSYLSDPDVEYRFALHDPWKRPLFFTVCRRHGKKPFRYHGQKRQSVMLRAPKRFADRVPWPEYLEVSDLLTDYLE